MNWLANLPIRAKLVLLQVVTAQVVLTAFAGLLAVNQVGSITASEAEQLHTASRLVAVNSIAPLEFIDEESAAEVLATLSVEPLIEVAWLYDAQGKPFARYPSDSQAHPELQQVERRLQRGKDGRAMLTQAVVKESGVRVGTLLVRSRPDRLRAELQRLGLNYALFLVVGLILASVLASLFERTISRPILELEQTVRQVAAEGDLSLRVEVDRTDELGRLSGEFNEMIDQMQARDHALRMLQSQLEHKVDERTAELAESEHFLSTVLGTMLDGLVVVTDDGEIREANAAAIRTLGGQVTGRSFSELFDLGSTTADRALARRTGQVTEAEALRNGERFPIELSVDRNAVEADAFFTVTFRDISERNRLKEMQQQFLSTVSHELRTPMTAIHGALRLVESSRLAPVPPAVSSVVSLAVNNSNRMIRLINDLLDIQRVQNDTFALELSVEPLEPLLRQAVADMAAYAEPFDVTVEVENCAPVDVQVDRRRLLQVLLNLISNAVKHSPSGSVVHVEGRALGEDVRVVVRDHGRGVPTEFADSLFTPFAQADTGDARQVEGTGLGLSITRAIVERHGGAIGYEPTDGGGATFWFTLPHHDQDPADR